MLLRTVHFFSILFSLNAEGVAISKVDEFKKIYQPIGVKAYNLSHEENITLLLNTLKVSNLPAKLKKIRTASVNCGEALPCALMQYEVQRLEERFKLAQKLKKAQVRNLQELKANPQLYKEVYRHSVFEWTNDFDFSFEKMLAFEQEEIKRLRLKLAKLKNSLGQSVTSHKKVTQRLKRLRKKVKKHLSKFVATYKVPKVRVALNENPRSQNVPGYYDSDSNTFFFSMPEGGVVMDDLEWLFLHEALPGHHFQIKKELNSSAKEITGRELVYLDFIEGWAAYVEIYGKDLGVYKSAASQKRALAWDLLRSVRVVVDVGLHLKGWSTKRAKAEWKRLAPEVFDRADREIKRMMRWPAQVISYEHGKKNLIEARDYALNQGVLLKDFHEKVLNTGQVPTKLIKSTYKKLPYRR